MAPIARLSVPELVTIGENPGSACSSNPIDANIRFIDAIEPAPFHCASPADSLHSYFRACRCVLATVKYLMHRNGFSERVQKEVTYALRMQYLLVALRQLACGLGVVDKLTEAKTTADISTSTKPRISHHDLRQCKPRMVLQVSDRPEKDRDSDADSALGDDDASSASSGAGTGGAGAVSSKSDAAKAPQTESQRPEEQYCLRPHDVKMLELSVRGWLDIDGQKRVNTLCEEIRRLIVRADIMGTSRIALEDDVLHPCIENHPEDPLAAIRRQVSSAAKDSAESTSVAEPTLATWVDAYNPDALLPPPLRLDGVAIEARDFEGYELVAESKDTEAFAGGLAEALPDLFIDLEHSPEATAPAPGRVPASGAGGASESKEADEEAALEESKAKMQDSQSPADSTKPSDIPLDRDGRPIGGTFENTENLVHWTLDRVNKLRQRSAMGQGSLVFLQLMILVEDTFIRRLPVVQPWA